LPVVDEVVAVAANQEGLASPVGHDLRPRWLWPSRPCEVGEFADLRDFHGRPLLVPFASARQEPGDQLLAADRDRDWSAVGQDRFLLPPQRDTTEPGDQPFPARLLDAGAAALNEKRQALRKLGDSLS
jgi:hypothetical protein